MSKIQAFQLHPSDNVVVAGANFNAGEAVDGCSTIPTQLILSGHKMAVKAIAPGTSVLKFGQIIGQATCDIAPGQHVHEHNLSMSAHRTDYAYAQDARPTELIPERDRETFMGYRRGDGKVGTRNYVGIVSSVNCSATVASLIVREVEKRAVLEDFPNVDGVVAITHGMGCAVSTANEGFRMLQRTIWGHARHPNFGAAMMVGLGCEANQIPMMVEHFGKPPEGSLHFTTIQYHGGTRRTIEACLDKLHNEILPRANQAKREPIPVSELVVALQCGGSDGYSGITANPALGLAVDKLVQRGGSAILAETPEVYGAEHLLTRRAASQEVGEKLIQLIHWWEDYVAKLDGDISNNPAPGNKAGGLTTILEKSLGAISKGGTTTLQSVLRYAEPVRGPGLHFMDSPGYDPMSITGEVASGANLICFTTGRGSVYGNKPCPSIKIATNSSMFNRMEEDMDINAGTIADGTESHEQVAERILARMIEVASGSLTKSEAQGFGDHEFVPWSISAIT
jgi:altronate hydrolase